MMISYDKNIRKDLKMEEMDEKMKKKEEEKGVCK